MVPSNPVTLALCEIPDNLVMDTLLASLGQHTKAVGHECSLPVNPSKVSPADNMQCIDDARTEEHLNVLALLPQVTTRSEQNTHTRSHTHARTHVHTHTHTHTRTYAQSRLISK